MNTLNDDEDPFGLDLHIASASTKASSYKQNPSLEDRRKSRKSMNRRVSFASHAHVRLFEKDTTDRTSAKNYTPMHELDLTCDSNDSLAADGFKIPDLSSMRRSRPCTNGAYNPQNANYSDGFNLRMSMDRNVQPLSEVNETVPSRNETPQSVKKSSNTLQKLSPCPAIHDSTDISFEVSVKGGSPDISRESLSFDDLRRDSVAGLFQASGTNFQTFSVDSDSDLENLQPTTRRNSTVSNARRDSIASFFDCAPDQTTRFNPNMPDAISAAESPMQKYSNSERLSKSLATPLGYAQKSSMEMERLMTPPTILKSVALESPLPVTSPAENTSVDMELVENSDIGKLSPDVDLVEDSPEHAAFEDNETMNVTRCYGNGILVQRKPPASTALDNVSKIPDQNADQQQQQQQQQTIEEEHVPSGSPAAVFKSSKLSMSPFTSSPAAKALSNRATPIMTPRIKAFLQRMQSEPSSPSLNHQIHQKDTSTKPSSSLRNSISAKLYPTEFKDLAPESKPAASSATLMSVDANRYQNMLSSKEPMSLPDSSQGGAPTTLDYARAACVHTPELYSFEFGCKALTEHIEEGRQSIRDMEIDVASFTPELFFKYAEASDLDRETLLQHLKLAKSYARLKTKEAWYGWREKILVPFNQAIVRNIESCKKDLHTIDNINEQILETLSAGVDNLETNTAEAEKLQKRYSQLSTCNDKDIVDLKDQISHLREQLEETPKLIDQANETLSSLVASEKELGNVANQLVQEIDNLNTALTAFVKAMPDDCIGIRERHHLLTLAQSWKPGNCDATKSLSLLFQDQVEVFMPSKTMQLQTKTLHKDDVNVSNLSLNDILSIAVANLKASCPLESLPKLIEDVAHLNNRITTIYMDVMDARQECPVELSMESIESLTATAMFFSKATRTRFSVSFHFDLSTCLYPYGRLRWTVNKNYGDVSEEEINAVLLMSKRGHGRLRRVCHELRSIL
ncbi:hypothetical protein HDV05_005324 [Chytridiales sp. JEL 0842]|nr:hypothetical protein HDV05_005324 [Chytridiales sp. JEL 0842]